MKISLDHSLEAGNMLFNDLNYFRRLDNYLVAIVCTADPTINNAYFRPSPDSHDPHFRPRDCTVTIHDQFYEIIRDGQPVPDVEQSINRISVMPRERLYFEGNLMEITGDGETRTLNFSL